MRDDRTGDYPPVLFEPSAGLLPRYTGPSPEARDPLAAVVRTVPGLVARLEAERRAAPVLWAELAPLLPAHRTLLVANRRRFQSFGLFELVLHHARAQRDPEGAPGEAERSRELAELALDIAEHLSPEQRAAAHGAVADAARRQRDLDSAAHHLAEAFAEVAAGGGDLMVRAHLHLDRARLEQDEGALRSAALDLAAAARLLEKLGNRAEAAQVRLEEASVVGLSDPERACRILEACWPRLDLAADPLLELAAHHLRISCVCEAGRPWMAAVLFEQAASLYDRSSNILVRIHRLWMEGRLLRATGEPRQAVFPLLRAYRALAELGRAQDLVLCALDLLEAYHLAGDHAEAGRLAASLADQLAAWNFDSEALALWASAAGARSHAEFATIALHLRQSWIGFTADVFRE